MKRNWLTKNKFYDPYSQIKYVRPREDIKMLQLEYLFYDQLLSKTSLIFDIGANHGDKTAIFEKYSNRVVAIEPDIYNIDFLKKRFRNNASIIIENKAVSNVVGETDFYVVNNGSGLNTIDVKQKDLLQITEIYKVEVTTLNDLFYKFGIPDYIKIDVEGHEFSILSSLDFPIKIISFEANLPQNLSSTVSIIKHLLKLQGNYLFNYGQDIGFISDQWITGEELITYLNSTHQTFLNIYCSCEK